MIYETTTRKFAERLRGIGKELFAIANELDAQAPHLSVNLPRDLFSDLDEPQQMLFEGIKEKIEHVEESPEPERKHYHRNAKRMQEHIAISTSERIGKAQGFCARNDIERSIARLTGRTREDVREAVNRVAERMQLTCVKSNSYRYYPKSMRDAIINASCEELERV